MGNIKKRLFVTITDGVNTSDYMIFFYVPVHPTYRHSILVRLLLKKLYERIK